MALWTLKIFISVIYSCQLYLGKTNAPCDFIFDRVIVLAWCKCSGGAWCSACIAFFYSKICTYRLYCGASKKRWLTSKQYITGVWSWSILLAQACLCEILLQMPVTNIGTFSTENYWCFCRTCVSMGYLGMQVSVRLFIHPFTYRTGSATLLRVAISSVETRKSRDFLWWKLHGISEEVTRVQRVVWKTSVEILATSVWSSV